MNRMARLLIAALVSLPGMVLAQLCEIQQVTSDMAANSILTRPKLSGDGQSLNMALNGSPTGQNADGSLEMFRWSAGGFTQLTDDWIASVDGYSSRDGRRIVFESSGTASGINPEGNSEIVLWDQTQGLQQLTQTTSGFVFTQRISGDGRRVFFSHSGEGIAGPNADGSHDLYLWDAGSTTRLTDSPFDFAPVCTNHDGSRLGFHSEGDLTGDNPGGTFQIFLWDEVGGIRQLTPAAHDGAGCAMSADGEVLVLNSSADLDGQGPVSGVALYLHRDNQFVRVLDGLPAVGFIDISADGRWVFFVSSLNPTGENPDGANQYFAWSSATGVLQLTGLPLGAYPTWANADDSGRHIAFSSNADLTGDNPDLGTEVFLGTCALPATALALPQPNLIPVLGLDSPWGWGLVGLLLVTCWAVLRRRFPA